MTCIKSSRWAEGDVQSREAAKQKQQTPDRSISEAHRLGILGRFKHIKKSEEVGWLIVGQSVDRDECFERNKRERSSKAHWKR